MFDVNNRIANFDLATHNIVLAKPGGIENRSTVKPDLNNFAPRIGLAYQVAAKTVVRSGYGIFYTLEDAGSNVWGTNPPFVISASSASDQITPSTSPRPSLGFPSLDAGATLTGRFLAVNARPTNFPSAYSQQWNISVEHQLGSFLFETAYVGNKAIKLLSALNINLPSPGPGVVNTRRPYAGWGAITYDGPFGAAMYNGLQTKVEKHLSSGLTFLVSYSFAKALDDSDSINLSTGGGLVTLQNPHDLRAEWGLGYNDVQHRLVTSYVYELPFGKGRRWLKGAGPVLNAIAGGWQTNGIWSAQTGLPFTIQSPSDTSNTGTGNIRRMPPDCRLTSRRISAAFPTG